MSIGSRAIDIDLQGSRVVTQVESTLENVVHTAIKAGLSVQDVFELAKRIAVQQAMQSATFGNGRANQSRIAARTGLTRPEVRAIISEIGSSRPLLKRRTSSRLLRILQGWPFVEERTGKRAALVPRRLSRAEFSKLVRETAGDIPASAALEELLELRWVCCHRRSGMLSVSFPQVRRTLRIAG
jgi:hypothetical protein